MRVRTAPGGRKLCLESARISARSSPRARVPFDPAGALLEQARAKANASLGDDVGDALDAALVDAEVGL